MAGRAYLADVLDALAEQFRLVGQHEQVHHDAGCVHLQRADDGLVEILQQRPHHAMALGVVGVAHVEAHHQRRLFLLGTALQQIGLPVGHLDRVRLGLDQRIDDARHILQPEKEARLVADAMIQRDIETAATGE